MKLAWGATRCRLSCATSRHEPSAPWSAGAAAQQQYLLPSQRRAPLPGARPAAGRRRLGHTRLRPAAAAAPPDMGQRVDGGVGMDIPAEAYFTNDADPRCTIIRICGRNDTGLLAQVTGFFTSKDIAVCSANISTDVEGQVCDIFLVTDTAGNKLPPESWPAIQRQLVELLSSSSRSSKPTIFGMAPSEDNSRNIKVIASEGDAAALEVAASEMAGAAGALVGLEREIIALSAAGAGAAEVAAKQNERAEASAVLERKMAAMEAILTSRRQVMEAPVVPEQQIPSFFQPPATVKTTGPAAGNGFEVILQGFNWESCKEPWYRKLMAQAAEISEAGFSAVWLPPSSDSVSSQGYLPRDLYDLNSKFGSEAELRELISVLHGAGLKAIADIVINHRCAHYQGDDGKWNKFGGRLAWDKTAVCSNNPAFGGTGRCKKGDDYSAAPNVDHSQERVRKDISEWMRYLRNSIGFDGWRFDYVKGYDGQHIREYVDATVPELAFGEYWDTCSYTDGVLNYNQDTHRQRTVDWCDATGATAAAFDFTTKGILQEALGKREYWRLIDSQGRPPGVIGIWPSRAITFIENHDTGSTLQHWPFPWKHAAEGYAYLLTHCGTPCVFYDHFYTDPVLKEHILKLLAIRRRFGINCKSEVTIKKAYNELYAAVVDKKIAMKIGPANWSPGSDKVEVGQKEWVLLHSGPNFAVWEAVF